MTTRQTFGEFLDTIIHATGLTRETIARRCGVSRRMIYHYVNDVHRPDPSTLDKLCDVLGLCPVDTANRIERRRDGRPQKD